MKHLLLLCVSLSIFLINPLKSQSWISVVSDASGDGSNPTLLDGTDFSYYYSAVGDSIYFKLDVSGFTMTSQQAVGVNVMVNIPGGGPTFNFWGSDNMNAYHKLVTTWVTGNPPSSYSGTIGVANASGVNSTNYTNLSSNNISIAVDVPNNNIVLGMKREDLITDAEMGGNKVTIGAAAAVGSNASWNDDLWSSSASITIDKGGATGIVSTNENMEVMVFPTYTSGVVNVRIGSVGINSVKVLNAGGQLVKEINTKSSSTLKIELPEANGLYFLSFTDEKNNTIVKKVMKQ